MPERRLGVLLVFIMTVLLACGLPTGARTNAQPTQIPAGVLTSVAQTVVAAQNQGKPTNIPPALLTAAAGTAVAALTQNAPTPPPPTATATPSPQPSPSLTPTITPTPTPSTPMISVSVNTNCRTGPGDAYDRVGALVVGETAEVLARDPSGQFWYIPNPDRPGGKCWVWGQYATVTGDTASLPVFTPPPTPTPVANFVIVGITKEPCNMTEWYFIEVRNTGSISWSSYQYTAENLSRNITTTYKGSTFPTQSTCIVLAPPTSLAPGHQGYLIPPYQLGWHGNRVRFTITLYTEDNQRGKSLTRVLETNLP